MIGPGFSGATKAVGASYDAARLVLISPISDQPDAHQLGFKSFHRVVPPDSLEGKEAGDWLAKKAKSGLRRRRPDPTTARAPPTRSRPS